ncbi:MAG: hypothetical protein ACRCZF_28360 [Gemmataceae bacterium]
MIPRLKETLAQLHAAPVQLFAIAFALSTLLLPYLGFAHDAILYGGQVLERVEPGSLKDDLFFQFGSQDKFSLFSPLMAPLVKLVGFPAAFAFGYALSLMVYVAGAVMLPRRLSPSPGWQIATSFSLVLIEATYGGNGVFMVPEGFLTPRLPACGFCLLALEAVLNGRLIRLALFGFLAMGLHPLMAVGPMAIAAGLLLWRWFGGPILTGLILLAIVGIAVAIGVPAVGQKLFGPMDAEWKAAVLQMTKYNFVAQWELMDWVKLAWSAGLLATVARLDRGQPLGRLAILTLIIGSVGLLTFVLAPQLPYALLFQGQGYRVVWLWGVLQLPLALWVAMRLWPQGELHKVFGTVLVAVSAGLLGLAPPSEIPAILAAVIVAIFTRGRKLWLAIAAGSVAGALMMDAEFVKALFDKPPDLVDMQLLSSVWFGISLRLYSVVARAAVVLFVLTLVGPGLRFWPLGIVLGCVAISGWAWQAERLTGRSIEPDLPRLQAYLRDHPNADGRPVCVYWCGSVNLWDQWYRLRACVYQHPAQASGSIFNKGTALEADRRAMLVVRYWLATTKWAKNFYPGEVDRREPDADLLIQLLREPAVDVVILPVSVPEVPGMTGELIGGVRLYDARKFRAGR